MPPARTPCDREVWFLSPTALWVGHAVAFTGASIYLDARPKLVCKRWGLAHNPFENLRADPRGHFRVAAAATTSVDGFVVYQDAEEAREAALVSSAFLIDHEVGQVRDTLFRFGRSIQRELDWRKSVRRAVPRPVPRPVEPPDDDEDDA